jgi:hypothetical protein
LKVILATNPQGVERVVPSEDYGLTADGVILDKQRAAERYRASLQRKTGGGPQPSRRAVKRMRNARKAKE